VARLALAFVLLCAGCAAPRVVRVSARYASLVPCVSAAVALEYER
jgi:hypothetical protein